MYCLIKPISVLNFEDLKLLPTFIELLCYIIEFQLPHFIEINDYVCSTKSAAEPTTG